MRADEMKTKTKPQYSVRRVHLGRTAQLDALAHACGTKVMLMPRPSTYEIDPAYFATIDTPNKAYWLGALAADGCVYYTQNKWRFQFIVAEKDQGWLLT